MKKLILTASLMVMAVAAFGQGQLIMNNGSTTRISADTNANGTADFLLPAGATSQVAVYGLAGNGIAEGSLVLQSTAITNLFAPGTFAGGTRTIGIPAGPATIQIRAWTGAYPSYEAALLAGAGGDQSVLTGRSNPFNITLTLPPTPPNTIISAGLNSFNAAPVVVPEPSSIALGLLGLGAIVLFRRRK